MLFGRHGQRVPRAASRSMPNILLAAILAVRNRICRSSVRSLRTGAPAPPPGRRAGPRSRRARARSGGHVIEGLDQKAELVAARDWQFPAVVARRHAAGGPRPDRGSGGHAPGAVQSREDRGQDGDTSTRVRVIAKLS